MSEDNNSKVTIVVDTLSHKKDRTSSSTSHNSEESSKSRHWGRRLLLFAFLVMLGVFGLTAYRTLSLTNKIFVGQKTTFIQKVQGFLRGSSGSIKLEGEDLGQVNVLLLGIGGEGHDGPYLSDTIILAQVRPDIKSISMTAIPRDYLVNLSGYGYRKINAAFAEGYYKHKDFDEAGRMARETVENITGVKIPYFAVIDFKGFSEAIDQVGGLDIQIDRTFTDYSYPDEKDGYLPAQTFKQGTEHMNGKRALIFSRSRHAAGPEGSDFSRSQRQQKVIKAFKEKVVSLNLITDVNKINNLAETFANHFHTNIQPGEIFRLYSIIKDYDKDSIFASSLDPNTKLICPKILEETGAYVLSPCPGKTEKDIQNFFKNSFTTGKLASEKPTVWIAASSEKELGYAEIRQDLENSGCTVLFVKSTETQTETVIYQVNPKPASTAFLKSSYGLREIYTLPSDFKVNKEKVDLVIILAQTGKTTPEVKGTDTQNKSLNNSTIKQTKPVSTPKNQIMEKESK